MDDDLKKILKRIEDRLDRLEKNELKTPPIDESQILPEKKDDRVGEPGLWESVNDFQCSACKEPFPNDATLEKGKHPLVNLKTRKVDVLCNKCYSEWKRLKTRGVRS